MSHKAIALLSGGLDSALAVLILVRQGIQVKAIKFRTHFDTDTSSASPGYYPVSLAGRFGFDVDVLDLGDRFLDIVKNPKHGYGKNMNPCIDCRILMLREAKVLMGQTGADFIVTGEVLGQRPMSQRKDMLYHIDKEAGVTDLVLRPLSAKLLRVTVPERKGIINRETFYDFSGRSRKPQMALAEEFLLKDYPLPAGGCLLTEPNYGFRLKDLLTFDPSPAVRDIDLLRIGRHFRFSPSCKIIIGRDEDENALIASLTVNGNCLLRVDGYGSPLTLVTGEITEEALRVAASLCTRYSDAKGMLEAEVLIIHREHTSRLKAITAGNEIIDALRIGRRRSEKVSTT